jgi:hypothetical protein
VTEARVWLEEKGRVEFLGGGDADGKVRRDGSFVFQDLDPGPYHIRVHPPEELYVKSISLSGEDISATGLNLSAGAALVGVDIVLSANGASIEGTVENGEGTRVTLLPADQARAGMLSRSVTAGANGKFSFSSVAPGRYKIFAWEDVDTNRVLYDAEFRKPYESKGLMVDLAPKQKETVQMRPTSTASN